MFTFVSMPYLLKYLDIRAHCIQCGKELPPTGRPDRKFCSKDCKNKFHNCQRHHYLLREELEGAVLRALDINHSILSRLYRMGVKSVELSTLSQLGYDPRFVTSYYCLGRRRYFTLFDLQFEMTPSQIKRLTSIAPEEFVRRK